MHEGLNEPAMLENEDCGWMMKEVVVDEVYCKMKWNMFGDIIKEWLGELIHLCRAAVTIPSTMDE